MILSMTGYGKAERKNKDFCVTVEIKSINNRFFDLIPKIHPLLKEFDLHSKIVSFFRER